MWSADAFGKRISGWRVTYPLIRFNPLTSALDEKSSNIAL